MSAAPPPLARWLVERTTVAADRAAVLGDLAEEFHTLVASDGAGAARRWYRRQALRSLVPNLRRRLRAPAIVPGPDSPSRGTLMTSLLQDLRFGWRSLRRRPLVTLVAAASLVVGLGATLVVFTLINAALLRPLPVRDPDRLGVVLEQRERNLNHNFSYQDFVDLSAPLPGFADLVAYSTVQATLGQPDGAEVIPGELVSGNYFPALGIAMKLGRGLGSADDDRSGGPIVVVSETLWLRAGDGRSAAGDATIVLNGVRFTVAGVVARPFRGMQVGRDAQFWAPLRLQPILEPASGGDFLSRPGLSWLTLLGRLRDGATLEAAGQQLTQLESSLPPNPSRNRTRRFVVAPGRQGDSFLPGAIASPLQLLLAAAGLVLLVACANVAGLLLTRAGERRRELALRTALGAGRSRLLSLLTGEALLLGLGSTVLAVGAGWLVARAVLPLITTYGESATLDLTPDWRVLGFALVAGVASTVLFGVLPVTGQLGRASAAAALGDGGRSASGGRTQAFVRRGLVIAQFAFALGLAGAAALLGRTLINLRASPTGFDLDHLVVVEVDPRAPRAQAAGVSPQLVAERVAQYVADGTARLAAVPGVRAASYARVLPLDFGGSRTTIAVDGYAPAAGEDMEINFNRVTAGYFDALGIAARDGRVIDAGDVRGAPPVAVVNESMARRYWPGQRPVGRTIDIGSPVTVVGVVPDVKYRMLREEAGPSFYLAFAQGQPSGGAFHVRTAGPPDTLLETLRRTVAQLDPQVPITRLRTLRTQADLNVNEDRLALTIALGLAGAAILLAAVGLYATMAQAVGRRTREIGVRLALGAAPGDVRRLVLREAVALAIAGSIAGLGLALAAGQLIRERLFGISAADPASLAVAVGVLAAVALIAAWAPARKAARVDPVEALRVE